MAATKRFLVLITGDREWGILEGSALERMEDYTEPLPSMSFETATLFKALLELKREYGRRLCIIHGGARGADRLAGTICKRMKIKCKKYLAKWDEYGRAAGVIRNQRMLEKSPDLVCAFHNNLWESKGTMDMVKRALKKGVLVRLYTTWIKGHPMWECVGAEK